MMENEGSDLSYSSYYEFKNSIDIETGNMKKVNPSFNVKNYFVKNLDVFQVSLPTLIVKSSTLKKFNLNFDSNIQVSEEFCLVMQLLSNQVKVSVSKIPLVAYRLSDNSLSVTGMKYWSKDRRYTLDKILNDKPYLKIKYKNELRDAYFKADYYEALYAYVKGKNLEARRIIKKAAFAKFNFFLIYILFHPSLAFIFRNILIRKYGRNFNFK
tara:strand:- start:103 stop:738 length:636 start_codon:yes stop_codon:yes gene_type:complete